MDISVTEFKEHCLRIIRGVEKSRRAVRITRHGKAVAQLEPAVQSGESDVAPWLLLRGSAVCSFEASDSVIREEEFEAMR